MPIDVRVGVFKWATEDTGLPPTVFTVETVLTDTEHPAVEVHLHYTVRTFASVPVLHTWTIKPSGEGELQPLTATLLRDFPLSAWERSARAHVEQRLEGPMRIHEAVARHYGLIADDQEIPDTGTITAIFGSRRPDGQRAVAAVVHEGGDPMRNAQVATTGTTGLRVTRAATGVTVTRPPTAEEYRDYGPQAVVDALQPELKDATSKGGQRRYRTLLRMAEVSARYLENVLAGAHNPSAATAEQLGMSLATASGLIHRARKEELLPPASAAALNRRDRSVGQAGTANVFVSGANGPAMAMSGDGPTLADYEALGAPAVVFALYPGLRNATEAADQQRRAELLRIADVAASFLQHQEDGADDPAALVADELSITRGEVLALLAEARAARLFPGES